MGALRGVQVFCVVACVLLGLALCALSMGAA